MNGKEKCRILKEIRAQIARDNDIAFAVSECTHKGDCRGTCPKCESEVRYLEGQLEKRRGAQKSVALAGICASLALSLSGCSAIEALVERARPTASPKPTQQIELAGEIDTTQQDELNPPEEETTLTGMVDTSSSGS